MKTLRAQRPWCAAKELPCTYKYRALGLPAGSDPQRTRKTLARSSALRRRSDRLYPGSDQRKMAKTFSLLLVVLAAALSTVALATPAYNGTS